MNKSNMAWSHQLQSAESRAWLTACLDPYHDFQYDLVGLPDQRSAPSVVQCHNQSYTLTKPTSAGTGTWDSSVIFTGINTPIGFDQTRGGMMLNAVTSAIHIASPMSLSSGYPFGALTMWAGAAGSSMTIGAPGTVGDTHAALGSVGTTDRCRVIGVGFEVHNTTASIYKQGSLTVAQLPDMSSDAANILYTDGETGGDSVMHWMQADRGPLVSHTLQSLMQVPGSQTWPAEKGVYAIPRMTSNPQNVTHYSFSESVGEYGSPITRVPIIYSSNGDSATPEPSGNLSDSRVVFTFKPSAPNNFSPIQVWCSGLSPETSLTVTLRTIVEYFPALGSPLLPLASPSPAYDARALELYSALIIQAPYAVPVGQNAAGDYFRKIASLVTSILRMSAPAFGEFAPLAIAASAAGDLLLRKTEQRKRVDKQSAGPAARQTKR